MDGDMTITVSVPGTRVETRVVNGTDVAVTVYCTIDHERAVPSAADLRLAAA